MGAIFGKTANTFLNTLQNPSVKLTDITSSIHQLYDILLNGSLTLPVLNDEYEEMLYNIDLSLTNLVSAFSETKIINGIPQKVGYSPVKIATSITDDPKNYLDELETEYQSSLLNLEQLYRRLNKDILHHKHLGYAFNNVEMQMTSNTDLRRFTQLTNTFNAIFRQSSYSDDIPFAIPYLISFMVLFRIYQRSFNFPGNVLEQLYNDDTFADSKIPDEFSQYLSDNCQSLGDSIGQYLSNNVFLFGEHISTAMSNVISTEVQNHLPVIGELFIEVQSDILSSDFIFSLMSDINYYIIADTVMYHLHDSFYKNIDDYWNIDSAALDYYSMEEDRIISGLTEFYNKNIEQANSCVTIANQFSSAQLFLLNSYALSYKQFTINLLQDSEYEPFTIQNVQSWLNAFHVNNANTSANLIEYVNTHPLQYDVNNDAFKLACFIRFREIILAFCDHDSFKNYIMTTFIKQLNKTVMTHYHIEIDWYNEIDKIITFFKTALMDHLLKDDSPLWGNYTAAVDQMVVDNIASSDIRITENSMENLLITDKSNYKGYYYIFNSFFKSAFLAKLLEKNMSTRYSL